MAYSLASNSIKLDYFLQQLKKLKEEERSLDNDHSKILRLYLEVGRFHFQFQVRFKVDELHLFYPNLYLNTHILIAILTRMTMQ